jgi:hypothetical protein
MNRRRQPRRTPLAAVERHRRSREVLVSRAIRAVILGASLPTVACRENMPRLATFRRWLAADPRLRARLEVAHEAQVHMLTDDLVAIADRGAARVSGRRRVAALRQQIAARKLRVEIVHARATAKGPRTDCLPLTEEDIAMLSARAAVFTRHPPETPEP